MRFKDVELVSEDTIFNLDNDAYVRIMTTALGQKLKLELDELKIVDGDGVGLEQLWVETLKENFKEIVRDKISFERFYHSWVAGNRAINASFPVNDINRNQMDMNFPHGLCLIGGLSMLGKSTFLRNLSAAWDVEYVIYGEPDYPSVNSRDELIAVIKEFMISNDRILIIDSISEFFIASGKSAAAAGGVNNRLLIDFPRFSNMLAMCGKTIVAAINFGDKRERIEDLTTAYSGKVAMYVNWRDVGSGVYTNRITRNRETVEFMVKDKPSKARGDDANKKKRVESTETNELEFSRFQPLNYSYTL